MYLKDDLIYKRWTYFSLRFNNVSLKSVLNNKIKTSEDYKVLKSGIKSAPTHSTPALTGTSKLSGTKLQVTVTVAQGHLRR